MINDVRGKLYVVGTPIGNLEDITLRAITVLKNVDACLAEDTRHTKKLFTRYTIDTKLISYHRFNEKSRISSILDQLREGKIFALVSDAGMPGISDPGERLIREAIYAGIPVDVIPGACSLINALILSGMRMDRFTFEGFLPRKGGKRTKRLTKIANDLNTVILFESSMRIKPLFADLYKYCADRQVALCRELTKTFEQTVRCSLSEILKKIQNNTLTVKGELVIVLEGKDAFEKAADDEPEDDMERL